MEVEKTQRNVLVVRYKDVREGWEQWFLLTSDRHHDSKKCNVALMKEHLEKAKERKAFVLDFGDMFDAMQGKYDPRRTYKEMQSKYLKMMDSQEEDEQNGYLDVIVKDAASFYAPYVKNILLIAKGNHETSIEEHNDVNLTQRLVSLLNEQGGHIHTGYIGGYVRFCFTISGSSRESVNLKYFHGTGGTNAPVTRGVIQTNRQAVMYPDADIVVNGHNHESYIVHVPRERLSDMGKVNHDVQWHIRTPGYKDGWDDGAEGFDVARGSPKAVGAVWLRFFHKAKHVQIEATPDVR